MAEGREQRSDSIVSRVRNGRRRADKEVMSRGRKHIFREKGGRRGERRTHRLRVEKKVRASSN